LRVSLIFGAEEDGVEGMASSSSIIAVMGGLVARGDGTATGCPKAEPGRPKPLRLEGRVAEGGGGLAIEPVGVGPDGAVPLLNSAQRGHFRFVSLEVNGIRTQWDASAESTYSCAPFDRNDHNAAVQKQMS